MLASYVRGRAVLQLGAIEVVTRDEDLLEHLRVPPAPEAPTMPPGKAVELDAQELALALRRTLFAAHPGPAGGLRYAIAGLLFDLPQGRIVATDGRRLSVADVKVWGSGAPFTVVPKEALSLLEQALPSRGRVRVATDGWKVYLRAGGTVIAAPKGGRFPIYEDALPDRRDRAVAIKRTDLRRMLPEQGTVRLAVVDGEVVEGEGLELDARQLDQVLRALSPLKRVELELGDGPAVVRAPGFVHVLMPQG